MGGLLHLVQRGGAWAGCGPAQRPSPLLVVPKCNSPPINGQCTNHCIAIYDGPLLCGFNVAIKGLNNSAADEYLGIEYTRSVVRLPKRVLGN